MEQKEGLYFAPVVRQVDSLRERLSTYGAVSPEGLTFVALARCLEAQLDSDIYRSASWTTDSFEFVTDSEHRIKVTVGKRHGRPATQRKSKFWIGVKGTDVVYRNWQIFGDELRQLDIELISFEKVTNGFKAEFLMKHPNGIGFFTIEATPTERFDLMRDYNPVHAAERMAPF